MNIYQIHQFHQFKEKLNEYYESKSSSVVEGSKTQIAGSDTENHVEKCVRDIWGDNIHVFKTGSQENPDFFIIHSKEWSEIGKQEITIVKRGPKKGHPKETKITKKFIENWERSSNNLRNVRFVRISVKSTKSGTYRVNRHPPRHKDITIFVNFYGPGRKVYVALARDIIKNSDCNEKNEIEIERRRQEFLVFARAHSGKDIPFSDAQPNRPASAKCMNVNSDESDIIEVFSKAGIK